MSYIKLSDDLSVDAVSGLYKTIFDEPLEREVVNQRLKKGRLSYHTFERADKVVGFTVLQWRDNSCHIWLLGLVKEERGLGLGHLCIAEVENHAVEHKASALTLATFNHRKEMLAIVIKHNFKIISTETGKYGDNVKIRLSKKLTLKKEIRILLTNKCNFKCLFCHDEGMAKTQNLENKSTVDILTYIDELLVLGYDDITFSGGEPLLRKKELCDIINALSNSTRPPSLTVVSNAYLIDQDFIDTVSSYSGNIKLNISLHSMNPETFSEIVKVDLPDCFERVCHNIKKCTAHHIKLKLNCVMLAGKNDSIEHVRDYCSKANNLGATSVKFLELLVIAENEQYYDLFKSAESIVDVLKSDEIEAKLISSNKRVQQFALTKFGSLKAEVTKCTCKIGCKNCSQVRDKTLGPNLNYYPCFIQNNKPIMVENSKLLRKAFLAGQNVLSKFGEKYGNDSPILIKQKEYVGSKSSAYFYIPLPPVEIDELLSSSQFSVHKKEHFLRWNCMPEQAHSVWTSGERSLTIGCDKHTPEPVKFFFHYNTCKAKNGLILQEEQFLTDTPPSCKSLCEATHIMKALNYTVGAKRDIFVTFYKGNGLYLSIGHQNGCYTIKVPEPYLYKNEVKRLLKDLQAKNIEVPFELWINQFNAS